MIQGAKVKMALRRLESLQVRRFEGFDCKESSWENRSTFQLFKLTDFLEEPR